MIIPTPAPPPVMNDPDLYISVWPMCSFQGQTHLGTDGYAHFILKWEFIPRHSESVGDAKTSVAEEGARAWGQGSRSTTEEEALETWEWETRHLPAPAELKHREKWLKKCGRWFKRRPRHEERGRKSRKVVKNSLKLKCVKLSGGRVRSDRCKGSQYSPHPSADRLFAL